MSVESLSRQIGIIQAAIKRPFDADPTVNGDVISYLAQMLDRSGVQDVRNLRSTVVAGGSTYVPAGVSVGYGTLVDLPTMTFFYDVTTGAIINDGQIGPQERVELPNLFMLAQSRTYDYSLFLVFSPEGYPIFYTINKKRTTTWQDLKEAGIALASIYIAVVVPALASEIGGAIMGAELAAQYPAVAAGIGNICINTALSGGNIESAVIGAVSGGVGNGVGGLVAGATDSAIIGAASAAATKAAIVGGNIEQAAAGSLLGSGISSIGSLDLFSAQPASPTTGSLGMFDDFGGDLPNVTAPVSYDIPPSFDPVSGAAPVYDWGWMGASVDPLAGGGVFSGAYDTTPITSPDSIDPGGSVLGVNPTSPPPSPSGVVASSGGADLTQLALTALKFVGAWQGAGQPALRASNASTQANANGTLVVRNANGTTSTVKMPVGTPYLTTTGELVTNNGDGTFTSIDSRGTVSTQRYPATSLSTFGAGVKIGNLTVSPMALGIGAVAAILLLRR